MYVDTYIGRDGYVDFTRSGWSQISQKGTDGHHTGRPGIPTTQTKTQIYLPAYLYLPTSTCLPLPAYIPILCTSIYRNYLPTVNYPSGHLVKEVHAHVV